MTVGKMESHDHQIPPLFGKKHGELDLYPTFLWTMSMLFGLRLHQTGKCSIQDGNLEPLLRDNFENLRGTGLFSIFHLPYFPFDVGKFF
jgi:hypothetical protein